MKHFISIDHIGYAVRNINDTAKLYVNSGWCLSPIFEEKVQNTKIAFLTKTGFTTIELVSPLEGPSPVDSYLLNGRIQPYHVCYVVDDVMSTINDLHEEDFIPLFMPVESVAMENRIICYLYNKEIGLIEIVNKH